MAERNHATRFRISDGRLILLAAIGMLAAFGALIFLISGGFVRHVPITFPEKTEVTVAFRNIDGEVKIVGLKGIAQVNPTLLMRTGDFAMELTVINDDSVPHVFYIDGLNVATQVLQPGESDVITFYSKGEATYNYYDWGNDEPIGQVRAVKVTMYE